MVVDWIKMAVGASIILVVGLVFRHYTNLVDTKAQLTAQVAAGELALQVEKTAVVQLKAVVDEWAEAQEQLRATLEVQIQVARAARAEADRINDIFARHDLEKLARAKPGLIERRLNTGTTNILRMLECASGASGCDPGGPPATDAAP